MENESILQKSLNSAFKGGISGSMAMVVNVSTLMWLRTTVNYQYRYGVNTRNALRNLYRDGGVARFYRGVVPALTLGPLSRFGDTATNSGVLLLLNSKESTKDMPIFVQTMLASTCAGLYRINLMPIDTIKTTLQVDGNLKSLFAKYRSNGLRVFYNGSIASGMATFAGHYPWFTTFNTLNAHLPQYDDGTFKQTVRYGTIGFCSSVVSDTVSNVVRVVKVNKQAYPKSITYKKIVTDVIKEKGVLNLLFRGLKTKILANGIQSIMFSILWKYFEGILA